MRTLAELRDTLLPKLISGEINIGEASHNLWSRLLKKGLIEHVIF